MAKKAEDVKPYNPQAVIRTLAAIITDQTCFDMELNERLLRECWLERELGIKIDLMRTKAEAYGYYIVHIHQMLNADPLIAFLDDLRRNGLHPDRQPYFLRWFGRQFWKQKQRFSLINVGSITHDAMALGRFGEKQNKPGITGRLITVAELAERETAEESLEERKAMMQ